MQHFDGGFAALSGRVDEHSHMFDDIRQTMARQFEAIDRRFESMDRRFDAIERRFEAVDRRFEAVDRRFEGLDRRLDGVDRRIESVDGRLVALDSKMSRHFLWLIGVQITTALALVSAMASMIRR